MTESERDPSVPDDATGATPEPEDDTEGHNLVTIELGQQMAREHTREARKIEADAKRRKELGRRSFLDRIRGR